MWSSCLSIGEGDEQRNEKNEFLIDCATLLVKPLAHLQILMHQDVLDLKSLQNCEIKERA